MACLQNLLILLVLSRIGLAVASPVAVCLAPQIKAGPQPPPRMPTPYVRSGSPDRVIVFIHGIFGSPEDTWRCAKGQSWPQLLLKDDAFTGADIYLARYATAYAG